MTPDIPAGQRASRDGEIDDLLVQLHQTLAKCRIRIGEEAAAEESLAMLNRALTCPGISTGHRARLLVLIARTRLGMREVDQAGRAADGALSVATQAGDSWATAWALHVLTITTALRGHIADALPIYDRALAVAQSDPALTDLRLLLQVNKAVALGNLDRLDDAIAVARQARHLADQGGTATQMAQVHGALGQVLYQSGQWDEALAELQVVHDNLKEPAAACGELGIAAVIRFHRGENGAARRHLAAAAPHARQLGNRHVSPFDLARSMDLELAGKLPEALAVLTGAISTAAEWDEVEEMLPDAVRLAAATGDMTSVQALTDRAAALAAGSKIPRWEANALYCSGLADRDAGRLLEAAGCYGGRPLSQGAALEAAAGQFAAGGDLVQARAAFNRAADVYEAIGAASDVIRLHAAFRAYGIRRGPRVSHRKARTGWASLTPTEIKIAGLVEEGLSNPEIAGRLMVSRRTVATHVSSILTKLGVHSRTEIARESVLRAITSR
jgi:DNA-binding CsgD family transcriptional regulator/tetratricopeptide (TPR) repeat protein